MKGYTKLVGGNAHPFHCIDFFLKVMFVFILFETYRRDTIRLKNQNKEIFKGEETGEKRSDMVDTESNQTNSEERTILQG